MSVLKNIDRYNGIYNTDDITHLHMKHKYVVRDTTAYRRFGPSTVRKVVISMYSQTLITCLNFVLIFSLKPLAWKSMYSREEGKDQESILSSTIPDLENIW